MADYKKLIPFVLKYEGGIVDDPDDAGGFTNKGVTLKTFRSVYGKDKTKEDLINSTLRGTLVGEGYDGGTIFVDSETRTELSEKDIAKINEALQK